MYSVELRTRRDFEVFIRVEAVTVRDLKKTLLSLPPSWEFYDVSELDIDLDFELEGLSIGNALVTKWLK
jgi:hypothetical protein